MHINTKTLSQRVNQKAHSTAELLSLLAHLFYCLLILFPSVKKIRFLSSLHDSHPATQGISSGQDHIGFADGQSGEEITDHGYHAAAAGEGGEGRGGGGGEGEEEAGEREPEVDEIGVANRIPADADAGSLGSVLPASLGGKGVRPAAAAVGGRKGVRRVMRQIRDTVHALTKGGAAANAAGSPGG